MKKKVLLFVVIIIVLNTVVYSQSGWFHQQSGVNTSLNSVYFINSKIGWICGDIGKIFKTTDGGNNWVQQNSNTTNTLNSIFFLDQNTGWIAGGIFDYNFISRMLVLRTTNGGNTWAVVYSQPNFTSYFVSIQFSDVQKGCAVERGGTGSGSVGAIWRTSNSGYNWLPASGSGNASGGIQFTDSNTAWVIGNYGDDTGHDTTYILKSTSGGNSWSRVFQKSKFGLSSSYFINNTTGWVSGRDSSSINFIMRTYNGGLNWERHNLENNIFLNLIFFTDNNTGWGCSGRIFKTTNSGLNWEMQLDYFGSFYNSIYFIDSLTGWVVSSNGKILKTITGGITSVNSYNDMPFKFSLSQNFPNPFNPSTIIQFYIPKSSFVKLKVFNSAGKEITTIISRNLIAGEHNYNFNAEKLGSGIYFYQIVANDPYGEDGEYRQTRKMVFLK